MVEQEEKNELNKKNYRKLKRNVILISRTKLGEQQQDSASSREVETLELKIMKLRKENEILKRKFSSMEACQRCSISNYGPHDLEIGLLPFNFMQV
ncbi:hypothetical protein GQ457_01G034800 [Hibiscus cannabinus]